ncbi:MAG TPA: hypothetical protein PKX93_10275, partial [bacterium]|nr:hypothetical protein [bacterium]
PFPGTATSFEKLKYTCQIIADGITLRQRLPGGAPCGKIITKSCGGFYVRNKIASATLSQ